jgi:hypothetical protein
VLPSLGRLAAGQRHQERFTLAVELRLRPRTRCLIQGSLQSALREARSGPLHGGSVHVQGGGNLVVKGPFAGLQQRVGAAHHTGRSTALANKQEKTNPIFLAQLDSVCLRAHGILQVQGKFPPPHLPRLSCGAPLV